MARVGIISDIHEPFCHPMYRRFVRDTFYQWDIDTIVFIGDVVDLHAISFWEHDPDGHSAGDEVRLAQKKVNLWSKAFPKAKVCIGNHDERHFRVAKKGGLPGLFLKEYKEVWNTPLWNWDFSHTIDGVQYEHGTGTSGKDAAINLAVQKRISTVIGHVHSFPGVKWHANVYDAIFGMNVGCGIDVKAYAFDYGKAFPIRPVLGCGIVIDGEYPYFEIMKCGKGQKYHRSRK